MHLSILPRPAAFFTAACAALLPLLPGAAQAAPPKLEFPAPSAHSVLKQRVGVTDVEIEYSRPDKNGRDIFGTLVPFGAVWRTGANAATTITLSDTVNLGGKDIPAGKYALFTIPGADQWTIILSKHAEQFGAFDYQESEDLARFTAKPATLAVPVETFTIGLADVKENSAQLELEWDRTCVSVPLTVDTTGKMQAEITRFAASPDATAGFYAQAANYYLTHHLDLNKALEWINLSIEKSSAEKSSPLGSFTIKAKIQAALGDKPGALASARKALELAQADPQYGSSVIKALTELVDSFR